MKIDPPSSGTDAAIRLGLLAALLVATGCPSPITPDGGVTIDASVLPIDSGWIEDGGIADAGPPARDAGPPDAGFLKVELEQWCATQAAAQCAQAGRCLRISPAGLEACLARKLSTCDQLAFTRAVREGRLDYAAAQAVKCLDGYGSGSCSESPAACATVFAGRVPPDGGCILSLECDAEGFCDQLDGRCPHRCRPWAAQNSACDDGFSTHCDPRRDACYPGDGGFFQFCQPFGGEDAGCSYFDQCRGDLACAGGRCVKREARAAEACGVASGFPYCVGDTFCRQAPSTPLQPGLCTPLAGVGGTCVGGSSCLASLRCSSTLTTGVCAARLRLGDPCVGAVDCEDELFCSGVTGRCERLPGSDGGDCSLGATGYRCASSAFCRYAGNGSYDFNCHLKREVGELCEMDISCRSNVCQLSLELDGGYARHCIQACATRFDAGF